MTPLIVVPARQMSEGRPGKNREAWPALCETLSAIPLAWPAVVVTDDPVIWQQLPTRCHGLWRPMGPDHTVARVVTYALAQNVSNDVSAVLVLQPSSPTRHRADYVRAAVQLLATRDDATAVVSVVPWLGEPPSKACYLTDDRLTIPQSQPEPRQAQPRAYRRDGTLYLTRRAQAQAGDLYGPQPVPLLIHPDDSVTLD